MFKYHCVSGTKSMLLWITIWHYCVVVPSYESKINIMLHLAKLKQVLKCTAQIFNNAGNFIGCIYQCHRRILEQYVIKRNLLWWDALWFLSNTCVFPVVIIVLRIMCFFGDGLFKFQTWYVAYKLMSNFTLIEIWKKQIDSYISVT